MNHEQLAHILRAIVPFGAFVEVVSGVVGLLPDKQRAAPPRRR